MSFGIIATLRALPIGKDFTHTSLEASHKYRLEHMQLKSLRVQRLLNWHERLGERPATGPPRRMVFSMLRRQGTLQL